MASVAAKMRIVRCPKCRMLLTEFSDVPVYKCGGCGAVLQAKNRQANKENGASERLSSISSKKNLLQHVSEAGGSSNDVPTLLNGQAALFSTDSSNTDTDHVGEHKPIAVPSEKASCSDSEDSCHKEEESSECAQNENMEAGLTDDNTSSTGQPGMLGEDTIFVASDSCHKEEESSECMENANLEAGLTDDNPSSAGQPGTLGKDTIFVASDSCHEEEESSECTENANMEAGLTDDDTSSTGQPGTPGKDTIFVASDQQGESIQVKKDSCSDEKLDDSWNLSEHGSLDSCSSCKLDATVGSLATGEDIVYADPGNMSCEKKNADPGNMSYEKKNAPTARSAYAYDGNDPFQDGISNSHEHYLLSSSAVRNKEVSDSNITKEKDRFRNKELSDSNSTKEKDGKENNLMENMEESKRHLQSSNLSSNSSDERHASTAVFGSSDLNRRSSSNHAYYRENSQHSDIFHSARKELEDDLLSASLSRDSSFQNLPRKGENDSPTRLRKLENDRMELLRKVDELRNHLTRPYTQGPEGNRRFHIRGIRQDSHWPLLCNHGSEQVLKYCNSNITQNHSRYVGQRGIAQPHQSLRVPFSGRGNSSCLHHHPEDWCIPLQVPHNSCCMACTHHVFCHPSTVSSPGCCKDCNVALCSHKSQTSDQHFQKLHRKEKRQPLKRLCMPVSGGAPFVICNNCEQLLQLPADFLISRARYHKLKCGGCSEVLIFLSHGGGHIVPHSGTQLDPAPSEIENAMEHVRRHELSKDHSHGCVQGDPVSYSEEYGPPFSNGYSTDGEPMPHILVSSLEQDRRHGKQAMGPALHRLMGYDSATELIYQPSDEDEAYESRDMAPLYRTSNEIHLNEAHRGTGMGYPLQGHSEIGCSPEHTETHKEDGYVRRSTDQRGASPLRGFLKKGIKEFNHGLESMKLKRQTGGRVIPAP